MTRHFDPSSEALASSPIRRAELAVNEAAERYRAANPTSARLAADAASWMPGGNTRSTLWVDPFPLYMASGAGSRLIDADGHEYVDFLSEYTCGIFGHSPSRISQAIVHALNDGMSLSSHNLLEARLARLLCDRFRSMQRVRFTTSGTEANVLALTLCVARLQRRKILVFESAYHGGVLNFSPGGAALRLPHEFVIGRYNDLPYAQQLIQGHREDLAAVLVEPMLGAAGCIPGSPEFLLGLRRLTSETGALLIFDEVQTARLARGGLQERLRILPDLTTVGKFFGGGLPFGCLGGRKELMDLFDPRRADALSHAGTFNNNILTMAAGVVAAETLTGEALAALNDRGERLRRALSTLFEDYHAPFSLSGIGSLMTIHPGGDSLRGSLLRKLLYFDLCQAGIYIAPRGLIALSLEITDNDIAALRSALADILAARHGLLTS